MTIPIWELIKDADIMINNLLLTRTMLKKLPNKNDIWVDSGGYQILIRNLRIGIDEIIRRYKIINANYYISLDIPCSDPLSFRDELLNVNINNYFYIRKKLPDKLVIPVVHLYPSKYLIKAVEIYVGNGANIIAYGGIVPPMIRKTRLRLMSIIGFIIIRRLFPKVKIHVLGIGSYVMTRIFRDLGANSLDTSTWRVKAAYGHVIIPGLGERYVGNRKLKFGTPYATRKELNLLYEELKRTNFPLINKFWDLLKTFKGRALVNAWVITKVDGEISRKSSFYQLYRKVMYYKTAPIDDLIKLYDEATMNK